MSRFSGPQGKGSMRQYREIKRAMAQERQANERARERNLRNFQFKEEVRRVMSNLRVSESTAERMVRQARKEAGL